MAASRNRISPVLWLHGCGVYIFLYLPIALLIFFSFNKSPLGSFPITGYTLDWYKELFGEYFLVQAFRNSIFIAAITVPIATTIGTLCAFGLAR